MNCNKSEFVNKHKILTNLMTQYKMLIYYDTIINKLQY